MEEKQRLSEPNRSRFAARTCIPANPGLLEGGVLVGYARVSTQDQNPNLQIDALTSAGCGPIFVETASGASKERPQLRAALAAARSGDVLAVWKLDRLGRSLLEMIQTVRDLDVRGIGFMSLTEKIDTVTPAGRLVLHLFGALAEFERSIILERTLAGLGAARARGRIGGRPRKVSDATLAAARQLMTETQLPMAEIARQLNVAPSTLYAHIPGGRGSLAR